MTNWCWFKCNRDMKQRLPRTKTSLFKTCVQRKAGRRQLYPSHGPLRFIPSHSFRSRLCHAKNVAPEEEAEATRLRQFYHVTKFSIHLSFTVHQNYTKFGRFTPVLSIEIVLSCFYLLISHFANFSTTWISRLPSQESHCAILLLKQEKKPLYFSICFEAANCLIYIKLRQKN